MIERLRAPQGAWDEDIVRVIEKVNELVDAVNEEKKELPKFKKTAVDQAEPKGNVEELQKSSKRTQTKRDVKNSNI